MKTTEALVVLVIAAISISIGVTFFGLSIVIKREPSVIQMESVPTSRSSFPLQRKGDMPVLPETSETAIFDKPGECHPRFPVLRNDQIHYLVKLWFDANCPLDQPKAHHCKFINIGRYLLDHAIKHEKTLLTVQIGAMDGKSNDPMYEMFATKRRWNMRSKDHFRTLRNWLPIMLEPVPDNFKNLVDNYDKIQSGHDLPCSLPMNAAISYSGETTECTFCRYNTSPNAPEECSHADWMKFQIGTLDCPYSKKFFGDRIYDKCIVKDPLPCGPVKMLMKQRAPYLESNVSVAMVQIDVEAYEYILLNGLVKDLNPLPPVIHFENKVMKSLDRRQPLESGEKRMDLAIKALEDAGYIVYEEGEDSLAFYFPK